MRHNPATEGACVICQDPQAYPGDVWRSCKLFSSPLPPPPLPCSPQVLLQCAQAPCLHMPATPHRQAAAAGFHRQRPWCCSLPTHCASCCCSTQPEGCRRPVCCCGGCQDVRDTPYAQGARGGCYQEQLAGGCMAAGGTCKHAACSEGRGCVTWCGATPAGYQVQVACISA
jgi:hypothetical protein